ncbi:MAG: pyruvate formate-lyase-activating protein [Clostridium sp.]
MINGNIHSIETMGLVDGPGIRFVVFMQGCKLRCLYCHNPDTWSMSSGEVISVDDLLKKVLRYKIYFENSGGGVTLSGGDPLMQTEFAIEFFKRCKENGIHTCLDTSGYGSGDYRELLKYTDLVLLDIKHIDEGIHKTITGQSREEFERFVESLRDSKSNIWIRHVILQGYTDNKDYLRGLAEYINTIDNVKKIELLAYHTHGVHKYEDLGIKYRLDGLNPFPKEKLKIIKEEFIKNIKDKSIQMH